MQKVWHHIHHGDPTKDRVVVYLKSYARCDKVTTVEHYQHCTYRGRCLVYNRELGKYESIGVMHVSRNDLDRSGR